MNTVKGNNLFIVGHLLTGIAGRVNSTATS